MKRSFFARSLLFAGIARTNRFAYSLALRQRYLHSSRVLAINYQNATQIPSEPLNPQKPANAKANAKPDAASGQQRTQQQQQGMSQQQSSARNSAERSVEQAKHGAGTETLTYKESMGAFNGATQANDLLRKQVGNFANGMQKREYATIADKAKEVKDAVVDKAKDVKDAAMKKGKEVKDAVADTAKDVKDKATAVKDAAASNSNVKDAVRSGKDMKESAKRAGQDAVDATKKRSYGTISDAMDKVAQKGEEMKAKLESSPTVKKIENTARDYAQDIKDKTEDLKESTSQQMQQRAETARNAYQAQPAAEEQGIIGRTLEKAKNMFRS